MYPTIDPHKMYNSVGVNIFVSCATITIFGNIFITTPSPNSFSLAVLTSSLPQALVTITLFV